MSPRQRPRLPSGMFGATLTGLVHTYGPVPLIRVTSLNNSTVYGFTHSLIAPAADGRLAIQVVTSAGDNKYHRWDAYVDAYLAALDIGEHGGYFVPVTGYGTWRGGTLYEDNAREILHCMQVQDGHWAWKPEQLAIARKTFGEA